MVPGGTTESISHFIGYLHLLEDAARSHPILTGAPGPARPLAFADAPDRAIRPDRSVEDLQSHPVSLNYQPGSVSLIGVTKHALAAAHISAPHPHLGHVPGIDAHLPDPILPTPELMLFRIDTVALGGAVMPAPQPEQLLADLRQANVLHNDGVVLTTPATPILEAVALSHQADGARQLPGLIAQADASTPDWLSEAKTTQTLTRAVASHDADPSGHSAPAVAPGIYADGAMQPHGTAYDAMLPTVAPTAVASHNGLITPGTDANTGGNVAINAASITDDHTQHTGFAVLGSSYTTDAIIQTNVLHSLADIAIGSAAGLPDVATGSNTAHNVASFAYHDLSTSFVSSNVPWAQLQLDTIQGDFYDVKAFSQLNYVSNNDIVSQGTSSAYSEISTGHNVQISELSFSELAQNYDLIVVGGSYHNTNAIIQQNVFLNDDVVRMLSGRGDVTGQSVSTGGNSLSNSAAIDHYGATATQPLTPDFATWLTHLQDGSIGEGDNTPPSVGSSVMHVLYITGDFFDINALSQTNIVSNVDTVAQIMPQVTSSVAPNGVPSTSTMAVDAGHNQLANLAGIAVVGTTSAFQFVGGQHYDDAILVQANLVSDKAHVVIGDTHTLASELVAFTGVHDSMPTVPEHVASAATDPSLHHDLFHGIMT